MKSDPNADLIGFEFKCDDGLTYRVSHTWDGPQGYMLCENGGDTVIRKADLIRRHKQLSR